MPFSVRVRDFQSIGDATIEVDGLTIITGQNNSGKTALIRAIFGAFTNARGTSFVRSGSDSAKVDIVFSDGRALSWEKGAKANRYELDGKILNRVGAGAPAETKTLGVYSIEASGRELWPQFAHQFVGQIFLLDEPGSVLAEAIANVDKVGVLNEALRLSQSDRRSAASDLKVRLEDVTRGELEFQKFDGLDEAVVKVRSLGPLKVKIEAGRKIRTEMISLRDRWVSSKQAVSKLLPARGISIANEDSVTRAKKTSAALEWVTGSSRRLVRAKSERDQAQKILDGVRSMVLPDPKMALETRVQLESVRVLATKWKTARETVETLTARLEALHKEHDSSVSEVKTLFRESGKCPFCGVNHENSSC